MMGFDFFFFFAFFFIFFGLFLMALIVFGWFWMGFGWFFDVFWVFPPHFTPFLRRAGLSVRFKGSFAQPWMCWRCLSCVTISAAASRLL